MGRWESCPASPAGSTPTGMDVKLQAWRSTLTQIHIHRPSYPVCISRHLLHWGGSYATASARLACVRASPQFWMLS